MFQEEVMSQKINRRKFLQVSAAGAAGLIIASCAPAVTTPTTAPAAPAATDTPAPAASVATPTPIATQASTATPVPTVAAAKYKEAPALADLVKAGKLPPVDQRLPTNPLVLSPIDQIGKYGGRFRKFWSGSWSGGFLEEMYGHSPLRWIDDGMGIAAGTCDKWSANADNSEWTLHFREGLKWSDGQPAGVDDVIWWWDNVTVKGDPAQPDSIPDFGQDANGKLVTFTKVDDYTLKLTYGTPAPLTAKRLAMWVNSNIGPRWICPAHYLKAFHPKFNTAEKDFKDFNDKSTVFTNPDCPVLTHWMLTKYDAGKAMTAERNPYYYAVDTEGNQLPYIDGEDYINVQDRQVELVQIRQGSIDHCHFHDLTLADISTLKDAADAGNYDVVLWDSGSGTAMMYFWNYDFPDITPEDKKVHDLFRDPAFKQAMSFALDRPTIQSTVYYGTGILTTGTMSPKAYEFNFNADAQAFGKKARDIYAAYDPAKSASLLDGAGYKAGADGKRTYKDGSKMEVRIDLTADASKECTDVLEIAKKNWEAVGLNIVVNQITGTAFDALWHSGKGAIHTNWEVGDGPDHLLYPSWVVPNEPDRWAPLCGRLLQFAGTSQATSEADKSPWDRQPPRFNPNDPEYKGTPIEKIHGLYAQAILEPDAAKRAALVWQMWQIHEDSGPFFIGIVANYPRITTISRKVTNYPTHDQLKLGGFVNPWIIPYPAVVNPETWSYK
jgi:peptide/nickel transport system substrate-binding protein